MKTIQRIFESIAKDNYRAAPTKLYNEGNLLLAVFEAADRGIDCLPFLVDPKSKLVSEGNLDSAFPGEGYTRADGVVGHLTFKLGRKRSIVLDPKFSQFDVCEVKLSSLLSPDITICDDWNQLTRNVACMAKALQQVNRRPETCNVGLHIVAPEKQIRKSCFAKEMDKNAIRADFVRRVGEYVDHPKYAAKHQALEEYLQQWALPMVERMELSCYPWESAMAKIEAVDGDGELAGFYEKCLFHGDLLKKFVA